MSLAPNFHVFPVSMAVCMLIATGSGRVFAADAPALPPSEVQGVALAGEQAINSDVAGLDAAQFEQIEAIRELEMLEQLRAAQEALGAALGGGDSAEEDLHGSVRGGGSSGPRGPAGSPVDGVFGSDGEGLFLGAPGHPSRDPRASAGGGGAGGGTFNPRGPASTGGNDTGYHTAPHSGDPGGTVTARVVRTNDGAVEYRFYRDAQGRTRTMVREHHRSDGTRAVTVITKDDRGAIVDVDYRVEEEEGQSEESDDGDADFPVTDGAGGGEPDEAREQRQRTRRLILSGGAFGQPKPDGSGTPSNSDGWWGWILGLSPPGHDSSPGMGPPDETTQPVQDGAQAAVIRRNLWAQLPWFVNPNPAGDAGSDGAESQDALNGEQAERTADAAGDAAATDTQDDPFAGYSLADIAEVERTMAGPGARGFVLVSGQGISSDTPGAGNDGGPRPPFSAMAGPGTSIGNFGSILSRGGFGGANPPIGANPNGVK